MRKSIILKIVFFSLASQAMSVQAEKMSKNQARTIKKKQGFLEKFDANKDGKVSKQEFKSSMGKRFQRMDADQNGEVSVDELHLYAMKQQNKGKKKKIDKHDLDKDGFISKEEFMAPRIKRMEDKFAELDKNNDGNLSVDEISLKKNKSHKKVSAPPLFPNIDLNKDGKISDNEKNAAFERLFSRLDRNQDQIVTVDEVKAGRANKVRK